MNIVTEIRKLPYSYIRGLDCILGSTWKNLMAIIPKYLDKHNYECNVSTTNPHKYTSEHIQLLESAAFRMRKSCTEILFNEWGTSGRIRPTLGHLLYLLIKAELYRAADYIAVIILNQLPPDRPENGPAALVTATLPDCYLRESKIILDFLNNTDSLISSLIHNRSVKVNYNLLNARPKPKRSHSSSLKNNQKRHMQEADSNSTTQDSSYLPKMSALNASSTYMQENLLNSEMPDLSIFNYKSSENEQIPNFSILLPNNTSKICKSPLPNLDLNTTLPHFAYSNIDAATNHFDKTPYNYFQHNTTGRFLGSGAFGSVHLALNIINKAVAVKKLFLNNKDLVKTNDPITKQFRNEVEILSKYKHENLVLLVGYSCDGPTYCLLYEFIPGGSLNDRLQNEEDTLLWINRLQIALGTSKGISYLHTAFSCPLIHRDIKSANILLDCNNKPKLCDFGLIRMISSQNTSTHTYALGTSAYMSHEAFRGDVSVKLDTYSFGVVLLELITGLKPIDQARAGCDIVTHVEEICEEDSIAPLIDLKAGSWCIRNINFAEELYKVAVKCLKENKKQRPTMIEIMVELTEIVTKYTVIYNNYK